MNATEEKLLAIQEKVERWNSLARTIQAPPELAVALMSGRHELVALAKPRAMEAEGVAILYQIIGCLIETNQALQEHSACIAELSEQQLGHVKGLSTSLQRVMQYGRFEKPAIEEDEWGDPIIFHKDPYRSADH